MAGIQMTALAGLDGLIQDLDKVQHAAERANQGTVGGEDLFNVQAEHHLVGMGCGKYIANELGKGVKVLQFLLISQIRTKGGQLGKGPARC